MPNHITNELTIIGTDEQINELLDYIAIKKGQAEGDVCGRGTIDFRNITPMPDWVYGSDPSIMGISFEDEAKYGRENTVLGWARIHWGTKWNAYNQGNDRNKENTIYFDTAWSGVPDLMRKLAWIFPDVTIKYRYADEDLGTNVGVYTFKGTEILQEDLLQSQSKEAYKTAIEVTGYQPSALVYDEETDNYRWVD